MKQTVLAILAASILTSCASESGSGRVTELDGACRVWRESLPTVTEDAPLADLMDAARQIVAYEASCGPL